jgi:hypothetical protein
MKTVISISSDGAKRKFTYFWLVFGMRTASVIQWSEFLATGSEAPGSIPYAIRFFEK